jgi:chemotaxis protein MotB
MSKRRRRSLPEEHEEHVDESWLVPYADILTLLLALFIVLYASSTVDKEKYTAIMESFKSEFAGTNIPDEQKGLTIPPSTENPEEKIPPKPPKEEEDKGDAVLEELKKKLEKYINENNLNAVVTLGDTNRGVEISFRDAALFDSGSAELEPHSFKTLNGLVGLINTVPNSVSIEGHTDNQPIRTSRFASNWELSSARAASVLHYFIGKKVDPKRLQFTGYGEYHPIYPNNTEDHRQANRRVTIVILRK